jgi:hypothetical protein
VAPERITVTVDRHGEPIVFGAQEGDGCSAVEYVRADRADAAEGLLREIRDGKHSIPGVLVQIDRLLPREPNGAAGE